MNGHSRHRAHIDRRAIGHQQARHRPIHYIDALHITRTNNHIGTLLGCGNQARQVVGIVREVAIHLDNIVIIALQAPAETGQVSRTQAQLTLAAKQVQAIGIILLTLTNDISRAIGRAIVNHQNIKLNGQRKDLIDHCRYVLALVVCRYKYKITHICLNFSQ